MPESKLTAISLLASAEGRLLLIGLTLTGLMLLAFAIGWQLFPERILAYGAMTGLDLAFGRAAGLSLGYASGFGHAQVIPFMLLVETIKALVLYPLFVLSWHRLIQLPRLQEFLTHMHRAAESGEGTVRKFGFVGLFVFVLAPVWATGSVVGTIIRFPDRLAHIDEPGRGAKCYLCRDWHVGTAVERIKRVGGNRESLCALCAVGGDCAHCRCDA